MTIDDGAIERLVAAAQQGDPEAFGALFDHYYGPVYRFVAARVGRPSDAEDLAQLVHQKKLAPVTIVSHSLGGSISLSYAGIYPESVARIVAIEGLGPPPAMIAARAKLRIHERMIEWIDSMRSLSGRAPRKYVNCLVCCRCPLPITCWKSLTSV